MLNLNTSFPLKSAPADADYPFGKAQNVSTPGDGTGTPWVADVVNDFYGWMGGLLQAAGLTPSGNPETAGASDILSALDTLYPRKGIAAGEVRTNDQLDLRYLVAGTGTSQIRNNGQLDARYALTGRIGSTAGADVRNNSQLDARYLQIGSSITPGPNSVGQSQLKTSVGSMVVSALATGRSQPGFARGSVTLPGGVYGMYPTVNSTEVISVSQGGSAVVTTTLGHGSGGNIARVGALAMTVGSGPLSSNSDSTATINATVSQRYVTASPPYNIGHGDIAHFIFLKYDSNNEIVAQYIADTPPWAYNGPTDIRPTDFEDDGHGGIIKKKLVICQGDCPTHPSEGGDPAEYAAFMVNPTTELVVIDNDMKNADMGLIPHPFDELEDGERVVLLDPTSDLVDQLAIMHEVGEDIAKLIAEGHVVIGDEITDCNKPDGVCVHQVSWKVS